MTGILQEIATLAASETKDSPPEEEHFHAKVTARTCRGVVHTWVEELMNGRGSILGQSLDDDNGEIELETVDWIRLSGVYAFTNKEDGSFWKQVQLRNHFKAYLDAVGYCWTPGSDHGLSRASPTDVSIEGCHGLCCVLAGDTLEIDPSDGVITGWANPSQEELADRDWLLGGGFLYQRCHWARHNESLLLGEDSDDNDE